MSVFNDTDAQSTEADAIAELALSGTVPEPIDEDTLYAVPDGHGGIRVLDTSEYGASPRFAAAERKVLDARSFVAYLDKHGIDGQTEVWSDQTTSEIVARIDAHRRAGEAPAREKHRLAIKLELTKPWQEWTKHDAKLWQDQEDFAEFIDLRAVDIESPTAADLIELVTSIRATTSVDFESSIRRESGQTRVEYKETINAKAGQKGDMAIPDELQLNLQPYVGGPVYRIRARFRFRIIGGNLRLGYVLERPQEVLDAAFADIVTEIRDGVSDETASDARPAYAGIGDRFPLYRGRP